MPRLRRKRNSRSWSRDHLEQLRFGIDSFGAWGDHTALRMQDRCNWPDAETLADMRAAWQQHGDELAELHGDTLWAALVFEQGHDPRAAIEIAREAYMKRLETGLER